MKFMNIVQKYMAPAGAESAGAGGIPAVAPTIPVATAIAPVVAPVAPVVAPVAPVLSEAPTPVVPVKLNYDNPAEKQTGDMLLSAGVDPIKAREAITANKGECTPEIYQALVLKHGEGMASLLANQMRQFHTNLADKNVAADKAVFEQVAEAFKGITKQTGEDTFKELDTWATKNIALDQRKQLNAAIAQGGFVAQLAVQELVNAFQESGDYTQPMKGIEGDNTPVQTAGGDLTRKEYLSELDELIKKGHVYETSPQIKTLQARRTRSAKKGI